MWLKLSVCLILVSLALQLCSTILKGSKSGEELYSQHPFLKNKVENVAAYVESDGLGKVKRHYRVVLDEDVVSEFFRQEKYIDVEDVLSNEIDKINTIGRLKISFRCDLDFTPSSLNQQFHPQWWDIHDLKNKKCYVKRPINRLRQEKAVYSQQKRVLYLYDYFD